MYKYCFPSFRVSRTDDGRTTGWHAATAATGIKGHMKFGNSTRKGRSHGSTMCLCMHNERSVQHIPVPFQTLTAPPPSHPTSCTSRPPRVEPTWPFLNRHQTLMADSHLYLLQVRLQSDPVNAISAFKSGYLSQLFLRHQWLYSIPFSGSSPSY